MPKRKPHGESIYQPPLDIDIATAGDYVPQPTVTPRQIAVGQNHLVAAKASLHGEPVPVKEEPPRIFDIDTEAPKPVPVVETPRPNRKELPQAAKELILKTRMDKAVDALTRKPDESDSDFRLRQARFLAEISRRASERSRGIVDRPPAGPAPDKPPFKPARTTKRKFAGRIPRDKKEKSRVPNSETQQPEPPERGGWRPYRT